MMPRASNDALRRIDTKCRLITSALLPCADVSFSRLCASFCIPLSSWLYWLALFNLSALYSAAFPLAVPQQCRIPQQHTAVLPKIPHSNSCKRFPNRPLRPRRGRFGTLSQQLVGVRNFVRAAVDSINNIRKGRCFSGGRHN